LLATIRHIQDDDRQSYDTIAAGTAFRPESPMLLASLALILAQPAMAAGTAHAALAPCNPDPLKGATCHAYAAPARAEARRATRGEGLAAVD
jgi:hypothetical protein